MVRNQCELVSRDRHPHDTACRRPAAVLVQVHVRLRRDQGAPNEEVGQLPHPCVIPLGALGNTVNLDCERYEIRISTVAVRRARLGFECVLSV